MLIKQIALKNFRQYKDLQVVEFAHGFFQDRLQTGVQFHGADSARPQTQLLGQRADAGADLQNARVSVYTGVLGDALRYPDGSQKVLPLGF